jgi:hypothetical protein
MKPAVAPAVRVRNRRLVVFIVMPCPETPAVLAAPELQTRAVPAVREGGSLEPV